MAKNKYIINNTRRYKRLFADYLIKYRPSHTESGAFLVANLKDISAGGVKFWNDIPLPEGALFWVEVLTMPIDRVIRGLARVVRVHQAKNRLVYYNALQFLEIPSEDQNALNSFIDRVAAESGGKALVPEPDTFRRRGHKRPGIF